MRFDNKVAFITGGAVGFGRAFGVALAHEGAAVALADIDGAAARQTALEMQASGARAIAVECDVADEAQVGSAVAETIEELGGIDILINNAGRHLTKYNQPFSLLPRQDLRDLFDVNVFGVVHCSIACRAAMRNRGGGAIVNIASIAGHLHVNP
jgi:3-oxoacyl-[acyl-carrier protein] reductase